MSQACTEDQKNEKNRLTWKPSCIFNPPPLLYLSSKGKVQREIIRVGRASQTQLVNIVFCLHGLALEVFSIQRDLVFIEENEISLNTKDLISCIV
jgi:hypothetical protein